MSRVPKIILFTTLVLGCAWSISACGSEDRSNLLPGGSVDQIEANIDIVQDEVDRGLCFEALDSADQVQKQVESLPPTVDPELKKTLLDGAVTLVQLVRDNCEDSGATGTTDQVEVIEPDPEVTPTGDTGVTGSGGQTGTTGNSGGQGTGPQNPAEPKPEPKPEPTPPTTPETPPTVEPPVNPGNGSGGITPNQ